MLLSDRILKMRQKYETCGLNYDIITKKYPNINEYEETVSAYLDDPFFKELEEMLDNEDYAMAKDATKGLYILSSELLLLPLYEALLEIYEDLEYETYDGVINHYKDMMVVYKKIRGIFNA